MEREQGHPGGLGTGRAEARNCREERKGLRWGEKEGRAVECKKTDVG